MSSKVSCVRTEDSMCCETSVNTSREFQYDSSVEIVDDCCYRYNESDDEEFSVF